MDWRLVVASIKDQVNDVNQGDSLETDVGSVINMIIYGIGIVAVIVIIIGGVNYMLSQGDPNKIKKAKDTILYGVIGLVVVLIAFAIVNFVLGVFK
jgi:multisubunit Na+/H+ antiporter MnhB subunit